MLLLLLEPEHLILRLPELILRPGNDRLSLRRRFCRLLQLLIGRFQLCIRLIPALFQPGRSSLARVSTPEDREVEPPVMEPPALST